MALPSPVMPTKNPNQARRRFLRALQRTLHGLELQKRRIASPLTASDDGVFDNENDADFYVYEMGRLRAIAVAAVRTFNKPQELVDALAAFDAAVPRLKDLRDPLTHPADDRKLDSIIWAGGHAELDFGPLRRVRYPVDSRYQHHDAAVTLGTLLRGWLKDGLTCRSGDR